MLRSYYIYWMIPLIIMVKSRHLLALEEQNSITTTLYYTDDKNQSIRIQPTYNDSLEIIQFKITCPDCKLNTNDLCIINISRVFNSCINGVPIEPGNRETVFVLNSLSMFVPENKDAFIPYPGCSYRFESGKNVMDIKKSCSMRGNISIPECVDGRCNCNKFNFSFICMTYQINDDILTIIADADFEDDLNVYAIEYDLDCPGIALSNKNHTDDNYHHIIIDVPMKENAVLYGQTCQISFKYLNQYSCGNAYAFNDFTVPEKSENSKLFYIVMPFLTIIVLFIIIGFKIIRRSDDENKAPRRTEQTFSNPIYYPLSIISSVNEGNENVDHQEYSQEQIRLIQRVGEGVFGEVFLAKSDRLYKEFGRVYSYIAVKKMKNNLTKQAKDEFLQEIDLMKQITDFTHVVRLIGYCTKSLPFMLITEFVCSGDLHKYLIAVRDEWNKTASLQQYTGEYINTNNDSGKPAVTRGASDDSQPPDTPSSMNDSECNSTITKFTNVSQNSPFLENEEKFEIPLEVELDNNELQNFALQIAKGMKHLESIPIIHRDLAARNVLVNENKVLKISDFGLSCMGDDNIALHERLKVPIRWTALDVLETLKYDMKSDVWSFAVVLWEIGMLGAFPYDDIDIDNIDNLKSQLQNGYRLKKPRMCSETLYEVMLRCWSRDSNLRPSFEELVDLLDCKKKRIYESFGVVNRTYGFLPTEKESEIN